MAKSKVAPVQSIVIVPAENGFGISVNRAVSGAVYDPGTLHVAVDFFDMSSILYDLIGDGSVD